LFALLLAFFGFSWTLQKEMFSIVFFFFFAVAYWILGVVYESIAKLPIERKIIFKVRILFLTFPTSPNLNLYHYLKIARREQLDDII